MTAATVSTVNAEADKAQAEMAVTTNETPFTKLATRVAKLLKAAQIAVINSDEMKDNGVDLNKLISTAYKKAEEMRLEEVAPLKQAAEKIDASYRPLKADLKTAQTLIKGKLDVYLDEQERIAAEQAAIARRAAEEQALRDAEAAQAAGNAKKADEILTQAVEAPALISVAPAPVARGEIGGYSRRSDWTFEVEDISKVPSEFLMVDEKKVKEAIKTRKEAGTIEQFQIPGIRIFEKKTGVTH